MHGKIINQTANLLLINGQTKKKNFQNQILNLYFIQLVFDKSTCKLANLYAAIQA
jgi:hypothetical protein